jgi:hypothetical protein
VKAKINGESPEADRNDHARWVYERAQECAHHDDLVMWQVVSITWAANSVLLAFALKEAGGTRALLLVLVSSMVGMILTIFSGYYYCISKVRQRVAYRLCRKIEKKLLKGSLRLRHEIDKTYDVTTFLGRTNHWVLVLNVLFLGAWTFTLGWAILARLCGR